MAKAKIQISNLNYKNLSTVANYVPTQIALGILFINTLVCMRAQIGAATDNVLSVEQLQGLPSQKDIAKHFNKEPVKDFLAIWAIADTLFADISLIKDLDNQGILDYFRTTISETTSPGQSKVLPLNRINVKDRATVCMHRRGLVSRFRGYCQSTPIYSRSTCITGINPLTLNLSGVIEITKETLSQLNIDLIPSIYLHYDIDNSPEKPLFEALSDEELISIVIAAFLTDQPTTAGDLLKFAKYIHDKVSDTEKPLLLYPDGIDVSLHQANLLPIEESLSRVLNIRRTNTPVAEDPINVPNNELTAAANAQLEKYRRTLQTGKGAKKIPPKTVTPKAPPTTISKSASKTSKRSNKTNKS